MKLDLENNEVIELLSILGDTYGELLMRHDLKKKGVRTRDTESVEVIEDLLFNTANIMLKINEQAHAAKLCACQNDDSIRLQRKYFDQSFKDRKATDLWFAEHIEAHGGFQIASPQSPTSDQSSAPNAPTDLQAQDRLQGSVERLKKKRQQKL